MKFQVQNYFRKLSLTQQVIALILLMVVFLLLFFTFFLSDSISRIISRQIYDLLGAGQMPIVRALDLGKKPDTDPELFRSISSDAVRTLIVSEKGIRLLPDPDRETLSDMDLSARLIGQAELMLADDQRMLETQEVFEGRIYYCRFVRTSSEKSAAIVVSYMDDAYAREARSSLMDSTVYVTVLVFLLLLLIFLLWVFSIIRPLNQIRAYIAQIKEGKDVDLYINREDEIGDVAQELRTLTEELAKQEKAKEEMIHNISHDLKTPIATIKSYSESIKDGIYPYGDLESSVDVILDNAKRLEDKVHSLLYMNRIEYLVSSDAEGVTTNMKDVVEEVVLNAKVIRPEIELITDVEEVYFEGLFESWRVCVENILQNAFRYARSYIRIEVHEDELIISNDGPKMPEDRIESLFKPYIKGEGGKFGLGLSIVSKVVAANRYKVRGMNTQDGVAFRVYRDTVRAKSSRFKTSVPHWSGSKKAASRPEPGEEARHELHHERHERHERRTDSETGSAEDKSRKSSQEHPRRRHRRRHAREGSFSSPDPALNADEVKTGSSRPDPHQDASGEKHQKGTH